MNIKHATVQVSSMSFSPVIARQAELQPLPWKAGGQTMSVCWNGSGWAQSWGGPACRGMPCWVMPGMFTVAGGYRAGW